jgi:hypothetical protein
MQYLADNTTTSPHLNTGSVFTYPGPNDPHCIANPHT